METEEELCYHEPRNTWSHQKLEDVRKDSSLGPPERIWPLGFRPLASRPVSESIHVIWSHPVCSALQYSPRKWIHLLHSCHHFEKSFLQVADIPWTQTPGWAGSGHRGWTWAQGTQPSPAQPTPARLQPAAEPWVWQWALTVSQATKFGVACEVALLFL